ncbi:hypothetical protein [Saccharomonospora sp.]|nr:hypothetical protein [Saccharomonospora sp.]
MTRPTRAEQRRARWALLAQVVTAVLALAAISVTARQQPETGSTARVKQE